MSGMNSDILIKCKHNHQCNQHGALEKYILLMKLAVVHDENLKEHKNMCSQPKYNIQTH
jgi:hypothetical protein